MTFKLTICRGRRNQARGFYLLVNFGRKSSSKCGNDIWLWHVVHVDQPRDCTQFAAVAGTIVWWMWLHWDKFIANSLIDVESVFWKAINCSSPNEVLEGYCKLWDLVCRPECLSSGDDVLLTFGLSFWVFEKPEGLGLSSVRATTEISSPLLQPLSPNQIKYTKILEWKNDENIQAHVQHTRIRDTLRAEHTFPQAALFLQMEVPWLPSYAFSALTMSIDGSVLWNRVIPASFPSAISEVQLGFLLDTVVKLEGAPLAVCF